VNYLFTANAWADYQHWAETDPVKLKRINDLIKDAARNPFRGLGKPEPLKGDLAGWWSRRIDDEHRLIYRLVGKVGADQRIEIAACRYHY
jgi:toxin YoeB